jgi:3-isopropylmalate/(R)-2-methylmalate dehydratase large subunit
MSANSGIFCNIRYEEIHYFCHLQSNTKIYKEALQKGLLEIFIDAGGVVSTPTCGPCVGGHMGVLASGERAVSTTNRNFVGRMGDPKSEVYLSNPAVAAASAILGKIGGN